MKLGPRRATKRADHVRMGKTLTVHGEVDTLMYHHCGAEQQYLLPMAVSAWVAMAKAFGKAHAHCPKTTETKTVYALKVPISNYIGGSEMQNSNNGKNSPEMIRVSAKSRVPAVAGAIAGVIREYRKVEMQAIGAGAINQTIKSLAVSRGYLVQDNLDIAVVPAFTEVEINGEVRTAMRLYVESRAFDPNVAPQEQWERHSAAEYAGVGFESVY